MATFGIEVHVVVIKKGGRLENELKNINNVYFHTITSGNRLIDKLKYLIQLRSLINAKKYDVIYGFLPGPNLALLTALTIRPRPIIAWGVRSSGLDLSQYGPKVKWAMKLEKWLSRLPDKIITNSIAARQEYRQMGYPHSKLHHIPNAIDINRFKPDDEASKLIRTQLGISENSPLIGLFARIHPMKDHTTFLHACKILIDRIPEAKFICAGDTSDGYSTLETTIKTNANNLGLNTHILWMGPREDPENLMTACDITTLTSNNGEGFPNSVAESMACGTLCIATDIGDASSIVSNFVDTVPPNDPEALAAAWQAALNQNKNIQRQISIQIRQSIVERFASDTITALTVETLVK